jgi:hypothetical protein
LTVDEEVAELRRTGMLHKHGPEIGGAISNGAASFDEAKSNEAADVPEVTKKGDAAAASSPTTPVAGKTSIGRQLLTCLRALDLSCGKGVVPVILKYIPSYRPKVVKKGSMWKDRIKLTPKDRMSALERHLYGHSATIHDSNSTPFTVVPREEREANENKRTEEAKAKAAAAAAAAAAATSGSKTARVSSTGEAAGDDKSAADISDTLLSDRRRSFLDVRAQGLLLRRPPIPLNHGVRSPGSNGSPFLHRFKKSSSGLMPSESDAGVGPMPPPMSGEDYKVQWPWVSPYVDDMNQASIEREKRRPHLK